ncbi:MAG: hypothetical protein AAF532_08835 [Planctomycetota bacterium]
MSDEVRPSGIGTTLPLLSRDLARPAVRVYLAVTVLVWGAVPTSLMLSTGQTPLPRFAAAVAAAVLASAFLAAATLVVRPRAALSCVGWGLIAPFLACALHTLSWNLAGAFAASEWGPTTSDQIFRTALVGPLFMAPVLICLTPLTIGTLFWFRWAIDAPSEARPGAEP